MAFLLTQAVEWILSERNINHAELARKEANNTLSWRVLTIHADVLRFLEEAASLADLRVRQQQSQEILQKISQQIEETLLAVEIYADEQRRLFIFPNLTKGSDAYATIEQIIAACNIDGVRLSSHLSDPVTNHPKDENGTYIGDQVLTQLQEQPPYHFDVNLVASFWGSSVSAKQRKQLCTACNIRPQGYGAEQVEAYQHNPDYYQGKAESRNICCICMAQRSGTAERWAEDGPNTTIWLDEV
ncbi:MAG: hypothetical protein CUN55_16465, partial [Phototrophicales bacterium]